MRNPAILCCLLLAVAGKGGLVYAKTKECRARMIVRVELLVYSGRENPSWQLTDSDSKSFFNMIDRLPKLETAPVRESLGYSGVRVICFDDGGRKLRTMTIYNGIVATQEGKTNFGLLDHGRHLEQWTVKTGETKLDPELYRYVLRELTF